MERQALLIALFLVGSVLGEYGWRPKQEYKYNVEGRSLTGIPGVKTQYAGIHYRGVLRVQSQASNVLMMKVQDMKYTKVHNDLPGGWWEAISSSEYDFQALPITGNTFVVKLDKGVVENLQVSKDLDDWEVNFLQGLVSQLQLDLSGSNGIHGSDINVMHGKEKEEPVFRVMEDTVVGRCEVIYEIANLPTSNAMASIKSGVNTFPKAEVCGSRNYIEITKTVNFDNCETRAEYHFGMPSNLRCQPGGARCGDFWSRSSVNQVLGCGDRKDFLLVSSVRSSQIMANLHFHNASQAAVSSYLNITVVSAKPTVRRFTQPNEPQTIKHLFYKYSSQQKSSGSCKFQETDRSSSPSDTNKKMQQSDSTSSSEEENKHKHEKRSTDKKKKKSSRKSDPKKVPTSTTPKNILSSESSEEGSASWRLSRVDSQHPPHRPFSPFSLLFRKGSERSCLVQQFKEIISEIAYDFDASVMIPEKMTLEKVYIAVQICRTMSLQDFKRSIGGIMESTSKDMNSILVTERKIFRDVVTMCGTNPAFQLIKSWIEEKKVKGEAAAEILAFLPSHLLTPNSDVLEQFYDLVRSPTVREDQQLQITAVLAFSNLVRVACVNETDRNARYPVQLIGTQCSPKDSEKYVLWLATQLRSDQALRQVFIRALGNTGASAAIPFLKATVGDNNESSLQRATAIYAMKFQIFRDSYNMSPYLLSVFHNASNPTALRIAAVSMLFYAKPSTAIWQRVAVSTWYDPSPAVATFVRSSLESLAVQQDPMYRNMAKEAATVLTLSKSISASVHRPYNYVTTSIADQIQQIVLHQLSWLPGPDTANLYYRQTRRLGGYSTVNFEAEMWLANTDNFMIVLQELIHPSDDVTIARPMIQNLSRSTKWLRDALNIAPRVLPRLEGALHFNWNQLTERLFPFDKKISIDLAKAGQKLLEQMKTGKSFHYQKMDQSSVVMATATEMGFPISYQVTVPWAIRVTGNTTLHKNKMQLNGNAGIKYTTQLLSDLSLFTDWDQTVHTSAAYANTVLQLPAITLVVQLDKPNSQMEIGVSIQEPNEDIRLVHHSSRSFTAQQDALKLIPMSLAKTTKFFHKRDKTQNAYISSNLLPNLRLEYNTESRVTSFNEHLQNSLSVLGFSLLWPTLTDNSLDLHLRDPAPITVNLSLGSATIDDGQMHVSNRTERSKNNTDSGSASMEDNQSSQERTSTTEQSETTTEESTSNTETTPTENTSNTEQPWSTSEKPTESSSEKPKKSTSRNQYEFSSESNKNQVAFIRKVDIDHDISIFNASYLDPFNNYQDNGTNNQYLLNEVLKGISSGKAYAVNVNLTVHGEELWRYYAFGAYAEAVGNKHHRIGFFFKNEKENSQMALTTITSVPSTPVIDFEQIRNTSLVARFQSDYLYKFNESQWQLALHGTITRAEKKMEALRSSTLYQECIMNNYVLSPSCRDMAEKATTLDHYNLTFRYNDELRQAFGSPASSSLNMAKILLYPYMTESSYEEEDANYANNGRITFELSNDTQTAYLALHTPTNDLQFVDVPITQLLASIMSFKPGKTFQENFMTRPQGYCGFSNKTVMTYDGVLFNYTLGDCWHLISKDCSGKSRVAILAKSKNNQTELEVNLDNYKVISLQAGPEVSVNQKKLLVTSNQVVVIEDEAGVKLAQMSLTPYNAIKMSLPAHGFTIVYTSDTVLIKADVRASGRLCGICGDNDSNLLGEFRGPSDHLESNPRAYASSYALKDKECKEYPKQH